MMGVFSCICSGVLWGRVGLQCRILGGVIVSFLGGEGEGKRNSRARNAETMRRCFAGRCEFRTAPVCMYILYVGQRRFHCSMLQAISKSALDLDALGSARALFRLRQPGDLVYASIYVKGLLLLVPPPRSGGYDVYIHAVYVVICYMSITCICLLYVVICYMSVICSMSVICLVLGPSCYMYMSVICCYMLYVGYMLYVCYMSSARGGS